MPILEIPPEADTIAVTKPSLEEDEALSQLQSKLDDLIAYARQKSEASTEWRDMLHRLESVRKTM
jgi:hypothetical protein